MKNFIKNLFLSSDQYKYHSEAVIISCFYNPTDSQYRLNAFNIWYDSIQHLEHRIIELVIGDGEFQLPDSPFIEKIRTDTLLWHKESLLNRIIQKLPRKYKYVFWVDADVIFTNKRWLVDGVKELKEQMLIQPFEFCYHLDRDCIEPNIDTAYCEEVFWDDKRLVPQFWRSFAANWFTFGKHAENYEDIHHGHVGFAWGTRREVLDIIKLYDKALIGGADHIMADASVGQIPSTCIRKSFTEDILAVERWMLEFYNIINGRVGYVPGNLFHIWHGKLAKRNYLKRIQEFTPKAKHINQVDKNGLYTTKDKDVNDYITGYFNYRDVIDSNGDILPEFKNSNVPIVYGELDHTYNFEPKYADHSSFDFGGAKEGFGGAGAEGSYAQPDVVILKANENVIPTDTSLPALFYEPDNFKFMGSTVIDENNNDFFVLSDKVETNSVDITSNSNEWIETTNNWDSNDNNGLS